MIAALGHLTSEPLSPMCCSLVFKTCSQASPYSIFLITCVRSTELRLMEQTEKLRVWRTGGLPKVMQPGGVHGNSGSDACTPGAPEAPPEHVPSSPGLLTILAGGLLYSYLPVARFQSHQQCSPVKQKCLVFTGASGGVFMCRVLLFHLVHGRHFICRAPTG